MNTRGDDGERENEGGRRTDKDAWRAVTDDVTGPGAPDSIAPGSFATEARRLFGVLRERVSDVVEPVRSDHPDVVAHLTAAGNELLAAYRAAVGKQEQRWSRSTVRTERVDLDEVGETEAVTVEIDEDDDEDRAGEGSQDDGRDPGDEAR